MTIIHELHLFTLYIHAIISYFGKNKDFHCHKSWVMNLLKCCAHMLHAVGLCNQECVF